MKKIILPAVLVLLATFTSYFSPLMAAEANVDFENENNYDAYAAGNGKIHVKVLLFSERGYDHNAGRGNNQSLGNDPATTCQATGSRLHTKRVSGGEEGFYKDFCRLVQSKGEEVPVFAEYVFNVFDTYFQIFQYTPDHEQRKMTLEYYASNTDSLLTGIYNYMEENREEMFYVYFVECAKQLGWLNEGYSYFGNLLAGTSFRKEDVLPSLLKGKDQELVATYDGSMYDDLVNNFFINTTCPLLFFYAHDDPWTAGAPPQLGPKAKMIVNPMGKHSSDLNDPNLCPPAIKQEVMDYVNACLN